MALKNNHGGTKHSSMKSSRHHKDIGSGSRPGTGRHGIETSAPKNALKLDGRGAGAKKV